jgi:lon-related putative ATP-dependent protease
MIEPARPLPPQSLFRRCDPDQFLFQDTQDLEDLNIILGQPRAIEAIQFGIGIKQDGYNIFALGPSGTGKQSMLVQKFSEQAAVQPVPNDWCYVHNFDQPHQPNAIQLPPGEGQRFSHAMDSLVEEIKTNINAAFDSEEYLTRRKILEQEFKGRQEKAFEAIQVEAQTSNLMVMRTPSGLAFAPTREGQVIAPEEFQKLDPKQQKEIEENIERLQFALQEVLEQVPRWQKDIRNRLLELNREITASAVGGLFKDLAVAYEAFSEVTAFLSAVEKDVIENARGFLEESETNAGDRESVQSSGTNYPDGPGGLARRYTVNVLIDHSQSTSAPVIYEDNPTYQNLVGRIEQIARMGTLVTDFHLIKPGCLHKANGGYLILDAHKLLTQQFAWEAIKRALQAGRIQIESVGQMLSLVSTVSLEPEAIPLKIKIALLGDRMLYYLLAQNDPDFPELFKVAADFDEWMDFTEETTTQYAALIATLARRYDLRPLDRTAVARVIEHSARLSSDSEKLSIMMNHIADLLQEADYWAARENVDIVLAKHVQQAIDAQIFRLDRIRERMQETVLRETVLIDTTGEKVGQINGLSVLQLGGFVFGHPSRITARVRIGKGEVLDIEREVNLGGPLHSKGVLILAGFLGARYAPDTPLSLSASLVFEQSYGGVEGDSASSAELYALLSAIAGVPIKQSLAVTGSVDQHGEVQAIGGVNEKIEGFFDLCAARGLTGEQGVIIPESNVKHLMLRPDIVEAAKNGQFHVYSVRTIDQGLTLLTGTDAGERNDQGKFPDGTVNALVQQSLAIMAEKQHAGGKEA